VSHSVYEEAKPVFRKNHFQIHAIYGDELKVIIPSVGNILTMNMYPEAQWQEGALLALVVNPHLRELRLNFYPGSLLLGRRPSIFSAWFLFPLDGSEPTEDNLSFIPENAPFLEKFQALPGFQEVHQIRGLQRVVCNFHYRIPLRVLSAADRTAFETYINETLCQRKTSADPVSPEWDITHARLVNDWI